MRERTGEREIWAMRRARATEASNTTQQE